MSGTHPEILYQLQQMRLHELQQRAATERLAAQLMTAWSNQWQEPIRQLLAYLAKVALLLSNSVNKPAPGCC